MTPQELKNSILQLAVQGKLVEQRPEEGTAEELFASIQNSKKELQSKGSISKGKKIIPIEDYPYDIPACWKWTKLGQVINDILVPMRDKPTVFDGNIPWCRIEDIEGKYLNGTKSGKYVSDEIVKAMSLRVNPIGTVISANSASVGAAAITTVECCTNQTFVGLVPSIGLYNEYLYYFLVANTNTLKRLGTGTTILYVSQEKYWNLPFPLPPLAEQKRIVAKIEELLPLIDRYEKAWSRLEEFNKRFPDDMQKSILQMAIQGKLVEQLDSDGNVDEQLISIEKKRERLMQSGQLKKLGKINKTAEVEIEIPNTWRLVRLYELICKRVDNRGKTPPHVSVKSEREYIDLLEINAIVPGASINHQKVEKFIDEGTYSALRGFVEEGDILIATVGSVGKFALMDSSKSAIAQNIIGIRCFDEVDQKYIFYLLQSPYFYESMGSIKMEAVQASIKVPDLMNLYVPLPPHAEQKRIVAKIEELLPLCQKLSIAK